MKNDGAQGDACHQKGNIWKVRCFFHYSARWVLNGSALAQPLHTLARMLVTPRTYQQLQVVEQEARKTDEYCCLPAIGLQLSLTAIQRAREMLLVYQVGSVKVGEVVRYALRRSTSRSYF